MDPSDAWKHRASCCSVQSHPTLNWSVNGGKEGAKIRTEGNLAQPKGPKETFLPTVYQLPGLLWVLAPFSLHQAPAIKLPLSEALLKHSLLPNV